MTESAPTEDASYHDDDDYAFYSGSEADDGDIYGLYRAVYAFEAAGENEMSIEEGDYLQVRGRGVGEGWVVAVKAQSDGREGLVPEGYLEKVYEGKGTHELVTSPQTMSSGQSEEDQ
ncbi:cytoskeletal protein binding protein [Cryptotrichosporon argae]